MKIILYASLLGFVALLAALVLAVCAAVSGVAGAPRVMIATAGVLAVLALCVGMFSRPVR